MTPSRFNDLNNHPNRMFLTVEQFHAPSSFGFPRMQDIPFVLDMNWQIANALRKQLTPK